MNQIVKNRLIKILVIIFFISSGISISLYFLSDNIVFFITPSEITEKHLGKKIRLGGLVKKDSIKKPTPNVTVFELTDQKNSMKVRYQGILPALFRESQGIVAEGELKNRNDIFIADKLLTKHDENYKPPQTLLEE